MRVLIADDEPLFVVLTGSDDPADVAKARRAGATRYLTKDQIAEGHVEAVLVAGAGGSRG